MAETYDITYESSPVGKAGMEKRGLYYHFSCRCRLPDEGLYRIHVICGGNREDLGICVPMGDAFGMDKAVSAKRLGDGLPVFELLPRDWTPRKPVIEREPEKTEQKEASEVLMPEPVGEDISYDGDKNIFIPVSEEEPFEDLDRLENAVMEVHDGEVGILFPETQ